jgi:hypothetical protein
MKKTWWSLIKEMKKTWWSLIKEMKKTWWSLIKNFDGNQLEELCGRLNGVF